MLLRIIIFFFLLFSFNFVFAQKTIIDQQGGDPADCGNGSKSEYCGDYTVGSIQVLLIRIANIILSIVGSLSFLAFVVGGMTFLLSAGNQDQVNKAKAIMFGAVAGLIVVFVSYSIISFVLSALGLSWDGGLAKPQ